MDKVNFLATDDYPVSTDTFDLMQKMIFLAAQTALIGGSNYILSGCIESIDRTIISDGIIVINGELLPFIGGQKKDKIAINETRRTLDAFDEKYPEAEILRTAIFSDDGQYNWSDFKRIPTNLELQKSFEAITGDAPGTVKMWAGMESKIPKDYMLCDGRMLLKEEYPELFENIGFMHGLEGVSGFKLPDLKGRFVVGFDNQHNDYKVIGNKGGAENVTLTVDQLANHKHIMPWGENPSTAWNPQWGYAPPPYNQDMRGSNSNDGDNSWAYSSDVGENKPHENRPPFYTLAYIIKVK